MKKKKVEFQSPLAIPQRAVLYSLFPTPESGLPARPWMGSASGTPEGPWNKDGAGKG